LCELPYLKRKLPQKAIGIKVAALARVDSRVVNAARQIRDSNSRLVRARQGLLLDGLHCHVPPLVLFAAGSFGVWSIAFRDIQLSTRIMLVLECLSMLLILVLGGIVLSRHGSWIKPIQPCCQAPKTRPIPSFLPMAGGLDSLRTPKSRKFLCKAARPLLSPTLQF